MSKLVLKRFRCITANDDVGDDSPYFLIFHGKVHRGSTPASSGVTRVRRSAWDNAVAEGELIQANVTVLNPLDADLVLVALMEEDWDADFGGQTLERLRGWIVPFFNSLGNAVAGMDGTVADLVRGEFRRGIKALRSNDDLVTVRSVVGPGVAMPPPLLHFKNSDDGTQYDVRFTVE